MGFLTKSQLKSMNFKKIGKNVQISDKATFYNCHLIEIGDYTRIDDFCILYGEIKIGRNVHIATHCLLDGRYGKITFGSFGGMSFGSKIINLKKDNNEIQIGNFVNISINCLIGNSVNIEDGAAIGLSSVVNSNIDGWFFYIGNPARKIQKRSDRIAELAKQYTSSTM